MTESNSSEELGKLRDGAQAALEALGGRGLTPSDSWRISTGSGPGSFMPAALALRASELTAIVHLDEVMANSQLPDPLRMPTTTPGAPEVGATNHRHLALIAQLRSNGIEPCWHLGSRTHIGEYLDLCAEAWERGEKPPEFTDGGLVDPEGGPVTESIAGLVTGPDHSQR